MNYILVMDIGGNYWLVWYDEMGFEHQRRVFLTP